MKTIVSFISLCIVFLTISACNKKEEPAQTDFGKMEVIVNDIPFKTNSFLRIPFSLKTWEWRKSGLSLRRIEIFDPANQNILASYDSSNFPRIQHDPLSVNPIIPADVINSYIFSIQLPVPLTNSYPQKVATRLLLRDTVQNKDVTVEGGIFIPRYNEEPLMISSPLKGSKWMFFNQSTNDYHFHELMICNGKICSGERFAFDAMILDDNYDKWCAGDPGKNSSYFCYKDTLFAVSDGVIIACRKDMPENDGNLHNHLDFSVPVDYAGNYIVLKIGNDKYAMYAHCSTNTLMISAGDSVKEGQPLALLGNAGNSDAPHLHFQIGDAPDFFMCNGVPFVLKSYKKIGEYQNPSSNTPVLYQNVMMEERTVISF